jgi:hypothetical protein
VGNVNSQINGTTNSPIDDIKYLAGEVKLLAINLAIALAKIQRRNKVLGRLEPQFTQLIKKANDTSLQVTAALKNYERDERMQFGLPASSEIIEKRGAYDGIEAKLNHVFDISQKILEILENIKRQEQVG